MRHRLPLNSGLRVADEALVTTTFGEGWRWVYPRYDHGMAAHHDHINEDLLAFCKT
jgi:hypothetical protein